MITTRYQVRVRFEATPKALAECSNHALHLHRIEVYRLLDESLSNHGILRHRYERDESYDAAVGGVQGDFVSRIEAMVVELELRKVLESYFEPKHEIGAVFVVKEEA